MIILFLDSESSPKKDCHFDKMRIFNPNNEDVQPTTWGCSTQKTQGCSPQKTRGCSPTNNIKLPANLVILHPLPCRSWTKQVPSVISTPLMMWPCGVVWWGMMGAGDWTCWKSWEQRLGARRSGGRGWRVSPFWKEQKGEVERGGCMYIDMYKYIYIYYICFFVRLRYGFRWWWWFQWLWWWWFRWWWWFQGNFESFLFNHLFTPYSRKWFDEYFSNGLKPWASREIGMFDHSVVNNLLVSFYWEAFLYRMNLKACGEGLGGWLGCRFYSW